MPHKTEQLYNIAEGWPRLSWLDRARMIVMVHNSRHRRAFVRLNWFLVGSLVLLAMPFRGGRELDVFSLAAGLGLCYYIILAGSRRRA